MAKKENKGLGDIVESVIKAVAPELAEEKKDCTECKDRKEKLNEFGKKVGRYMKNNFNGNFS